MDVQLGGIGFVHYNMTVDEHVAAVKQAKTRLPWAAAQFATAPADAPVAILWPLQVGLHVESGTGACLQQVSRFKAACSGCVCTGIAAATAILTLASSPSWLTTQPVLHLPR